MIARIGPAVKPLQFGADAEPVHMIKLTATQEITPYKWPHPDEARWGAGSPGGDL
jgi:hypothetical protein